jgi:hypothetical protein
LEGEVPLHIPGLAKKLQCLYQRHPAVNTHELLAEYLNIAPNNISTWINGNEVRGRELVPNRHIRHITDLFEIPVQWLETDSLEEFKALLDLSRSRAGPWSRLLARAAVSDAIHLVRRELTPERVNIARGLVADDEGSALEQFHVGERLYIPVTLNGEWLDRAARGQAYAVILARCPARPLWPAQPVFTSCQFSRRRQVWKVTGRLSRVEGPLATLLP